MNSMADEYVWGLLPWQQALLWIGSVLVYVLIGGFTWALTPTNWNEDANPPIKHVVSVFWPVTLAGYIVYRIATFGPRVIKTLRERNRLPRAKVREKP